MTRDDMIEKAAATLAEAHEHRDPDARESLIRIAHGYLGIADRLLA